MYLTHGPIRSTEPPPAGFHSGAEVTFTGRVRDHSEGRKVLYLEYEAYEEMAERVIRSLVSRAKERWAVDFIRVVHRLGKIGLGEAAVFIEVRAAHRDEAYQASRFLIEEIKHCVPIWKKEYFEDGGAGWGVCRHGAEEAVPC